MSFQIQTIIGRETIEPSLAELVEAYLSELDQNRWDQWDLSTANDNRQRAKSEDEHGPQH